MFEIIINITRFIFILLAIYFTYLCYKLYRCKYKAVNNKKNKSMTQGSNENFYLKNQRITLLITHFLGFMILIGASDKHKLDLLILYVEQVMFFMIIWFLLKKLYTEYNYLLWNTSLYLISISFIILARIDYNVGYRQFLMAILGYLFAIIVPIFIDRFTFLDKLEWVYIGISIIFLVIVNFVGTEKHGATNWILIGDFSFQPSEIIKILFILFLAAYMRKRDKIIHVVIAAIPSLILIILLVYQKDLGTALIFFIIFISVIYISTNKPFYFLGGLSGGIVGSFIAYKYYSHVRDRVEAWINPWADIDRKGYQIAQSLFAIGAGGFFGKGLTKGMPKVIPAVETDIIFAAICEEFGNIFSILLIIIMALFFLSGIKIAKGTKDNFYLLLASGISCTFAFQMFLILAGVTKLIPLTGVTLPFVSSGGTSLTMSIIMLGILEGIHIKNQKGETNEKKKRTSKQKR
ncbi:FtsW/RodA/SpoVE family cell cycle protein [Vallitalea guaymasensis]|uniref:FtsW/RodA/SpoVE family cell cycle protein n=1 Tax=Vallitalea guaymasensis TaxID=1185412 RepID=A0A8J8MFI0_9FIRM|nr:FtsW/RodA/SpoVE family cell cycle protein [Vallitalea guaymasensis]QUH31695.1 FtsW/RodA/SpoVE family cell cycle protein [Vallitalea guaymasensis]